MEAGKSYADGMGRETRAALADGIDIGLLDKGPGLGEFDRALLALPGATSHRNRSTMVALAAVGAND